MPKLIFCFGDLRIAKADFWYHSFDPARIDSPVLDLVSVVSH